MPKKGTVISYFLAFLVIAMMVLSSLLYHRHEFVLPEIAAMVIAMWAYRDPNWLRHPLHICIAPTATCIIGMSVNHLHLAYLCKAGIALTGIMAFLFLIRSNFAPSLATGLLPLITNAHNWMLVLIVLASTLMIMCVVVFFRMNAGLEKKKVIRYRYSFVFLMLVFAWMGICGAAGFDRLGVIPPMIVVVYESIQKREYNGNMALKQGIALTISATVGTLLFLHVKSMAIVTFADIFAMLLLQWSLHVRIPAIYAFPLFPLIFPPDVVPALPLATLATCLFMFPAMTAYKRLEKSARTEKSGVPM